MTNHRIIYHNGRIFTSNPEQPNAEAMVVENGRIEWVGDNEKSESFEGERVNLNGRRVIPGFVDAHLHPLYLANSAKQIACTAPLVNSIDEMIVEVREQRAMQQAGEWVEGWGYDEGKLADGRTPVRHDLDKAVTDSPVIITRTCGHIIVVNSKALELAGITKDTPNPRGGEIDHDEHGEPTGILRENAKDLVTQKMPVLSIEENAERLAELTPFLFKRGITAITDLMAHVAPIDYMELYEEARKRGLEHRTVLYYMWEDLEKSPILNKENTDRTKPIHIGGIKLFADGSVSGRTAWVNPSFCGDDDNQGISTTSSEELLAAAKMAKEHGIQVVVHAMGEQAIDQIVNTFGNVDNWIEGAPSVRIEHAAMPTKHALEIASKKGFAFVPQPVFLYAEIESYHNNLGIERTKTTYPVKTMLEADIKVAFSSDAPATAWADPVDPFVGIQSAVTRIAYNGADTGQSERVSIATAIELYTRCAQEVTRIPDVGQLKVGYHADFIVLDQDILEVPAEKIAQVKVENTYLGGRLVYSTPIKTN